MSLIHVHVNVKVKSGMADAFVAATKENARNSREESGVVRFDLLRVADGPDDFLLVEIYRDTEAGVAHKETDHYRVWRETVADMMAEPRSNRKFSNIDPDDDGWA